jgi:hypothetical protein
MGMKLMQDIPHAMQDIPKHQHNRHSTPQYTENSKYGYSASFESPCSCSAEVGSERQIEAGDWHEEQTEEDLLYLCREHLLRNRDRPSCRHQPNTYIEGDDHGQRHRSLLSALAVMAARFLTPNAGPQAPPMAAATQERSNCLVCQGAPP